MRERHAAGAENVADADTVFGRAELVVKVKEPIGEERTKLHRGQVLFTYLHLAPDRALTEALIASVVTAIAYETATSPQGALAHPMSEIAGRMKRSEIRGRPCNLAEKIPSNRNCLL